MFKTYITHALLVLVGFCTPFLAIGTYLLIDSDYDPFGIMMFLTFAVFLGILPIILVGRRMILVPKKIRGFYSELEWERIEAQWEHGSRINKHLRIGEDFLMDMKFPSLYPLKEIVTVHYGKLQSYFIAIPTPAAYFLIINDQGTKHEIQIKKRDYDHREKLNAILRERCPKLEAIADKLIVNRVIGPISVPK